MAATWQLSEGKTEIRLVDNGVRKLSMPNHTDEVLYRLNRYEKMVEELKSQIAALSNRLTE